jgi:hypothetical protein
MIRYDSTTQLTIEQFKTPFQTSLRSDNRWVKLAEKVPWDKFASIYISRMNKGFGRPGISPRMVLGALIIKHKEKLDDRGVIEAIQENPYMQYFIGLREFDSDPIFDPSLFVEIRKRVGHKEYDALTAKLIKTVNKKADEKHNKKHTGGNNHGDPTANKGKLKVDATVADQYIPYPTDNGLLNESRKKCESLIDHLYQLNGKKGTKPRTYRRVLSGQYASYTKKQKKSPATHRKMTRKLLEAVSRDIGHIGKLLDGFEEDGRPFPLKPHQQKMLWVISNVYHQQKYMYDNKLHTCPDRIVNIFQPHVRPIPRGKTKAQTEFGSKLGVSLDSGFARISTLSWDAYHEAGDLIKQVEDYKTLHGHYPEVIQADRIYATRENRQWLKKRGIRITAPPLGRKKTKEPPSYYQKRKRKKEAQERNHIEGKFGQGKNGYNLNKIRARLRETSESWIACIFFVMNMIHYEKCTNIFCLFFEAIERAFGVISKDILPTLEYQKAVIGYKTAIKN